METVLCPMCRQAVAVMPEHAGTVLACPFCRSQFTAPDLPQVVQVVPTAVTDIRRLKRRQGIPAGFAISLIVLIVVAGLAAAFVSMHNPAEGETAFGLGSVLLGVVGLFIYFIPSLIGISRKNAAAIIALNIFLGWTILGWVFALVWALTSDD